VWPYQDPENYREAGSNLLTMQLFVGFVVALISIYRELHSVVKVDSFKIAKVGSN
jgi:hypothetical protein